MICVEYFIHKTLYMCQKKKHLGILLVSKFQPNLKKNRKRKEKERKRRWGLTTSQVTSCILSNAGYWPLRDRFTLTADHQKIEMVFFFSIPATSPVATIHVVATHCMRPSLEYSFYGLRKCCEAEFYNYLTRLRFPENTSMSNKVPRRITISQLLCIDECKQAFIQSAHR